jgi:outer membrane protein TolC
LLALLLLAACKSVSTSSGEKLCLAPDQAASDCAQASAAQQRSQLRLPPFLRDGAEITNAIPGKSVEPALKTASSPKRPVSLQQAATEAALSHPEIRAAEARVRESKAGVDMANAALYPQGDLRLAAGGAANGNFNGRHHFEKGQPDGNARFDGTLSLRQLIYDFGATRADMERAAYIRDAEKLKLLEKVDEIVLKTSQAYLRILEQRALLTVVDETIAAHRKLAEIVQANQREGNGTAADVNRVNARLTDITAIRSDVSLQLAGAEEQFHRLTKIQPGALGAVPMLASRLPRDPAQAIDMMRRQNPRLGSMHATALSIGKELEGQRAGQLPKINLEVDGDSKNFAALNRHKNEADARALVTLRYRFMDGGLGRATLDQLHNRQEAQQHLLRNEEEQTAADIRQAYRAVDSARRKEKLVAEGVGTSRKVLELYLEQFKAGRRTVFELLDAQMSGFTVRRSEIESRHEAQRATFEILRHTGRLAEALSQASPGERTAARPMRSAAPAAAVRPQPKPSIEPSAGEGPVSYPVSPSRRPRRIDEAKLAAAAEGGKPAR